MSTRLQGVQDGINLLTAVNNNDMMTALKLVSTVSPHYQDVALRISVRHDKWDIFVALLPLVSLRDTAIIIAAEDGKLNYLEALLTPGYKCDDVAVIAALLNHQMKTAKLLLTYEARNKIFAECILERLINDKHEELFDIFITSNPGYEYDYPLVESVKTDNTAFAMKCLTLNVTRCGYVDALYEIRSTVVAEMLLHCELIDIDYDLRDDLIRYYTKQQRMDIVNVFTY